MEDFVVAEKHAGMIGVLTMGEFNPMMILAKSIRFQGIYCGANKCSKT